MVIKEELQNFYTKQDFRMELNSLLRKLISDEENKVRNSFSHDNDCTKKHLLLELVRALDIFYESSSGKSAEFCAHYQHGWNEILSLVYGDYVDKKKFPLAPSTGNSWDWAHSSIQHCGRIAFAKKIISFCDAGLAVMERGENQDIYVDFDDVSDWEQYDVDSFDWCRKLVKNNKVNPEKVRLDKEFPRIFELLKDNVDVWEKHFIQYNSTPEIDEYYTKHASLVSCLKQGKDNFKGDTKFGGVEYRKYCMVVDEIIGLALKHVGFCAALTAKNPDVDLRNTTSITREQDKFAESMSRYMDIDVKGMRQILECLTLTPENCEYHLSVPQGPPPPFIKVADNIVIESVAGCQENPFIFLNRELRRKYEKDYFCAVNDREELFREEIYSLFARSPFFYLKKPVEIGNGKLKTDIDAALLDGSTGTLALFQLKWQEPFGNSLKERYSRITNFYPKSVEWIDKVQHWLKTQPEEKVLSILQLKGFRKALLFILNRNSVFFTGIKPDKRAAWSTGWQFIKTFSEIPINTPDFLSILHKRIVESSPAGKKREKIEDSRFQFSGYDFLLRDNMHRN